MGQSSTACFPSGPPQAPHLPLLPLLSCGGPSLLSRQGRVCMLAGAMATDTFLPSPVAYFRFRSVV